METEERRGKRHESRQTDRHAGCSLGPLGPLDSPAETKRRESGEIEEEAHGDGRKERQET